MGARVALATLLIVAVLHNVRADSPWFCRGAPCPRFSVESKEPEYEIRVYDAAAWASYNVTGIGSRVEIALARASLPLTRYLRGSNHRGERVISGKPVAVAVTPRYKFTEVEDSFVVSYYLPDVTEASAPRPNDSAISLFDSPDSAQLYVYQFGGFATTASILSSAAKLATALEADNLHYNESGFLFLMYDRPWQFRNRHNEIWMTSKWSDMQKQLQSSPHRA